MLTPASMTAMRPAKVLAPARAACENELGLGSVGRQPDAKLLLHCGGGDAIGRMLRAVLAIAFLSGAVAVASAADPPSRAADPLDGLRFAGKTGEKGKGDHHEDTITFGNGIFRSLDCENWGFGAGRYTVERKGDAYHFKSILTSPNRGKLEWAGKIVGDKAIATFRWTHERWYWTIKRDYWFEGTRQAGER